MLENKENTKKIDLFLAALSPYIENNTPENVEKKISGKDFVGWGDNNAYPKFLWDCYSNCATLQSIINGTADYIAGDDVICNIPKFQTVVNKDGETINDIVQRISMDYLIYGSFAVQIIRNMLGEVNEIYWVDINKLRSDEKNEVFFYSDDWNKSYGRVKYLTYPKFRVEDKNPTSIFYYKGNKTRSVYGTPIWNAAVKNAQIEIAITDFHNNEINNNFLTSKIISFNNGVPDDELKLEIERNLNDKFGSSKNAGRVMISFSDDKEHAPEIINLGTDNFDVRYETLEKRNKNQLFIAFRAQPILFGMLKENNGFSQDEYLQSFALYNRTMVKPIQKNIVDVFDKIFDIKDSVTIKPFSVEVVDNTLTDKNVIS
jgi:hypothetical protein